MNYKHKYNKYKTKYCLLRQLHKMEGGGGDGEREIKKQKISDSRNQHDRIVSELKIKTESAIKALTGEELSKLTYEIVHELLTTDEFTYPRSKALFKKIIGLGFMSSSEQNQINIIKLVVSKLTRSDVQQQGNKIQGQVKYMRPDQIRMLTLDQIEGLELKHVQELTEEQLQSFKKHIREIIQHLSPSQIPKLTINQINQLKPMHIQLLTSSQIPLLTEDQLQALTKEQIQELNQSQIHALTPGQINLFLENQIKYLTESQTQFLTEEQLRNLIIVNVKSLKHIDELTDNQIQSFTTDQIIALTFAQIQILAKSAILSRKKIGFSSDQVSVLTPSKVNITARHLLNNITPVQQQIQDNIFQQTERFNRYMLSSAERKSQRDSVPTPQGNPLVTPVIQKSEFTTVHDFRKHWIGLNDTTLGQYNATNGILTGQQISLVCGKPNITKENAETYHPITNRFGLSKDVYNLAQDKFHGLIIKICTGADGLMKSTFELNDYRKLQTLLTVPREISYNDEIMQSTWEQVATLEYFTGHKFFREYRTFLMNDSTKWYAYRDLFGTHKYPAKINLDEIVQIANDDPKCIDLNKRCSFISNFISDNSRINKFITMDGHGRILQRIVNDLGPYQITSRNINVAICEYDPKNTTYANHVWHQLTMPYNVAYYGNIFDHDFCKRHLQTTFVYLNFCGFSGQEDNIIGLVKIMKGLHCKQNLMISFSHARGAKEPASILEEFLIYTEKFSILTGREDFKTYVYIPN